MSLVSWEKICYPKNQGGLNIKGCGKWNVASDGELIRQLVMSKESLWVKWVHDIYIKTDTIWTHKTPVDSSWYWRKINSLKNMMQYWYTQGQFNLTANGKYSITSGYNALIGKQEKLEVAKLVWNSIVLPKQRLFLWLAMQNRLLTKDRLINMGVAIEYSRCCLCQNGMIESHKHLFVECDYVAKVSAELLQWANIYIPARELKPSLEMIKLKHWKKYK